MIVINYGHPLGVDVLERVALQTDNVIGEVKNIPCQLDLTADFGPQAVKLVDAVGWSAEQWQRHQFVVSLPGMAPMAACVLAEIHGRAGYWPTCIRLAPVAGASPPRFAYAELMELSAIREEARKRRAQ